MPVKGADLRDHRPESEIRRGAFAAVMGKTVGQIPRQNTPRDENKMGAKPNESCFPEFCI
jgi:hypothetical protein